jgi:murein DD-endopeptidase MepM/ murein hydrolase activator NlpD
LSSFKLVATLGLLSFSTQTLAAQPEGTQADVLPVVGIPFACDLQFEVSQAHETGSHLGNDTWAWDFRMPAGVPIVAAKDGVVRMARGDSTVGGCDAKFAADANYVVIDHGDGFETQYLHFTSVVVQAGQQVKAGELLGYSGATGWACGSHLHFKVAKRVHNGWNNPSVPARIEGYGDPQPETVIHAPACSARKPEVIQASAEKAKDTSDTQRTAAAGASGKTGLPIERGVPAVAPAVLSR